MKATRKLLYVIGAVFTVRLVLLGCAPVIGVPSARPLSASVSSEVGLGGGVVTDSLSLDGVSETVQGSPLAHVYYRGKREGGRSERGAVLSLGTHSSVGAGGYFRINLGEGSDGEETEPAPIVSLAMQIELGFLYAGLSMPIAVAVTDYFWITSQPRLAMIATDSGFLGPESDGGLILPLGVSFSGNSGLALDLSCGWVAGPSYSFCGVNLGYGR